MIPLIQQALDTPPASAKQQTASGLDANSHRHAWKREMERAQSEAWFKDKAAAQGNPQQVAPPRRPAVIQALGAVSASEFVATHPRGGRGSHVGIPTEEPSRVATRASDLPVQLQVPTAPARSTSLVSGQSALAMPLTPAFDSNHRAPDVAPRGAAAGRTTSPFPGQRNPVRVHAQWDGNDVSLWLGLDVDQTNQATQLVDTLRTWLQSQGLRPVSIVCNGQLVWQADDAPHTPTTNSATPASRQLNAAESHFHIIATRES
jgi:hypothetical protein